MNDDREDLYQEIILDHNRNPANFRPMENATRRIEADNPLCGDRLELFLRIEGERIADISFQGSGCAISVASASLLTERLKGLNVGEAADWFRTLHKVLTEEDAGADEADLGDLAALTGVCRYPMRVKRHPELARTQGRAIRRRRDIGHDRVKPRLHFLLASREEQYRFATGSSRAPAIRRP